MTLSVKDQKLKLYLALLLKDQRNGLTDREGEVAYLLLQEPEVREAFFTEPPELSIEIQEREPGEDWEKTFTLE